MFQRIIELTKKSYAVWSEQRSSSRGAAIAFYTVTSIAPIILLVIAIAELVFGQDAGARRSIRTIQRFAGSEIRGNTLQDAISGAANKGSGIAASVISVITLLLSCSGVFVELEDSVNAVWGAQAAGGLKGMAKSRLISLALVIGLGFFLIVSLVVEAALKALTGVIPFGAIIGLIVSFIVSLAITSVLFAAMFKYCRRNTLNGVTCGSAASRRQCCLRSASCCSRISLGNSSSFKFGCGRGADCAAVLGLLHGADLSFRRRVYPRLCRTAPKRRPAGVQPAGPAGADALTRFSRRKRNG